MNVEGVKKYWPYALGGGIALYFIYKKFRGGGNVAANDPTAQIIASQAAMSAQAGQLQLAQQQVTAQTEASQNAAAIASTNATANLAASIGSSLSQIIGAQSVLPAMAINSVGTQNQTALTSAAQVAMTSMGVLPGAMSAQAQQIQATANQFVNYANATGADVSSFLSSLPGMVNAVGSASSSATQAVGYSASAATQANAQTSAGYTGLASDLLMAYSDERLKKNIVHIGYFGRFKLYSWDWNSEAQYVGADKQANFGVIAQEVIEVMPEAVSHHASGYLQVNYAVLVKEHIESRKGLSV